MTKLEQEWSERVRAWRESGLTAREFSTGRGFSAGTLHHWAYRLKKRGLRSEAVPSKPAERKSRATPRARVRLVRLQSSAALATSSVLTVEIGASRLRIPPGADATTLRTTIAALIEAQGGAR